MLFIGSGRFVIGHGSQKPAPSLFRLARTPVGGGETHLSVQRLFRPRYGFTLIELLVAMSIVSLLVALLLPAIQSAREATRRTQCQNNVKQIALALLLYHDLYRSFPQGGWGHEWVGDPDQGVGQRQPGGWIYQILPNIEEGNLHDLGTGATGSTAAEMYSERMQTPIALFVCPSRRPCVAWPVVATYTWVHTPKPFGDVTAVARADYAINAGTSNVLNYPGPTDLVQGNDPEFWNKQAPYPKGFSGISHLRTSASMKTITDGTSNTYLLGEKYLEPANYSSGVSVGDNESLYAGYCTDLYRFAGAIENMKVSQSPLVAPLSDQTTPETGMSGSVRFGSSHSDGFQMAFCDGSVHFVAFDVDAEVHFRSGHRRDNGTPIDQLK
jgi:prepilin-type N-terminal cleavage/methylation domain-containing protein/prepilin-type processing-associated H-X9-DG protein